MVKVVKNSLVYNCVYCFGRSMDIFYYKLNILWIFLVGCILEEFVGKSLLNIEIGMKMKEYLMLNYCVRLIFR